MSTPRIASETGSPPPTLTIYSTDTNRQHVFPLSLNEPLIIGRKLQGHIFPKTQVVSREHMSLTWLNNGDVRILSHGLHSLLLSKQVKGAMSSAGQIVEYLKSALLSPLPPLSAFGELRKAGPVDIIKTTKGDIQPSYYIRPGSSLLFYLVPPQEDKASFPCFLNNPPPAGAKSVTEQGVPSNMKEERKGIVMDNRRVSIANTDMEPPPSSPPTMASGTPAAPSPTSVAPTTPSRRTLREQIKLGMVPTPVSSSTSSSSSSSSSSSTSAPGHGHAISVGVSPGRSLASVLQDIDREEEKLLRHAEDTVEDSGDEEGKRNGPGSSFSGNESLEGRGPGSGLRRQRSNSIKTSLDGKGRVAKSMNSTSSDGNVFGDPTKGKVTTPSGRGRTKSATGSASGSAKKIARLQFQSYRDDDDYDSGTGSSGSSGSDMRSKALLHISRQLELEHKARSERGDDDSDVGEEACMPYHDRMPHEDRRGSRRLSNSIGDVRSLSSHEGYPHQQYYQPSPTNNEPATNQGSRNVDKCSEDSSMGLRSLVYHGQHDSGSCVSHNSREFLSHKDNSVSSGLMSGASAPASAIALSSASSSSSSSSSVPIVPVTSSPNRLQSPSAPPPPKPSSRILNKFKLLNDDVDDDIDAEEEESRNLNAMGGSMSEKKRPNSSAFESLHDDDGDDDPLNNLNREAHTGRDRQVAISNLGRGGLLVSGTGSIQAKGPHDRQDKGKQKKSNGLVDDADDERWLVHNSYAGSIGGNSYSNSRNIGRDDEGRCDEGGKTARSAIDDAVIGQKRKHPTSPGDDAPDYPRRRSNGEMQGYECEINDIHSPDPKRPRTDPCVIVNGEVEQKSLLPQANLPVPSSSSASSSLDQQAPGSPNLFSQHTSGVTTSTTPNATSASAPASLPGIYPDIVDENNVPVQPYLPPRVKKPSYSPQRHAVVVTNTRSVSTARSTVPSVDTDGTSSAEIGDSSVGRYKDYIDLGGASTNSSSSSSSSNSLFPPSPNEDITMELHSFPMPSDLPANRSQSDAISTQQRRVTITNSLSNTTPMPSTSFTTSSSSSSTASPVSSLLRSPHKVPTPLPIFENVHCILLPKGLGKVQVSTLLLQRLSFFGFCLCMLSSLNGFS